MYNIIICFMIYSLIGWGYESTICSLTKYKKLINRGFLNGPYLPIYGFGAVMNILILQNTVNIFVIFIVAVVVSTILEYVTSLVLELVFQRRWWDYSSLPLNVNGRICFLASFIFGTSVVLLNLVIHPLISNYIMLWDNNVIFILSISIVSVIIIDLLFTIKNLNLQKDEIKVKIRQGNKRTKDFIATKIRFIT